MGDSSTAEIVDLIQVALGLRVIAVALYPPRTNRKPRLFVIAEDLPAPSERSEFLASLTPPNSFAGAEEVVLKTPDEFETDPESLYAELAAGRVMVDRGGLLLQRLATLRASSSV
jgi:hypothetical protein